MAKLTNKSILPKERVKMIAKMWSASKPAQPAKVVKESGTVMAKKHGTHASQML